MQGSGTGAIWWAIQLALDIDTCRALLRGEPVDPDRLDPVWLARAEAVKLVSLNICAADLFEHWPALQTTP